MHGIRLRDKKNAVLWWVPSFNYFIQPTMGLFSSALPKDSPTFLCLPYYLYLSSFRKLFLVPLRFKYFCVYRLASFHLPQLIFHYLLQELLLNYLIL